MNDSPAQTRERLEQEAVAWHTRITSGDMDAVERTRFEEWRGQSLAHGQAYRKIETLWQMLGAPLKADRKRRHPPDEDLATQATPTGSLAKFANAPARPASPASDRRNGQWAKATVHAGRLRRWRLGLAAAASLFLAVGLTFYPDYLQNPLADYRTHIGERTSVQLADGSTVHLNTDTALDVSLGGKERRVVLLRGEAEFEVAHDGKRPFRVKAGGTTTEALGTRFTVRYDGLRGIVTLLEGKVYTAHISPQSEALDAVTLRPGERVAFNGERLGEVQAADPAAADAWRRGRLVMNFVALGDVIAELNRYRRGQVKLLDNDLARREVNVAIDIDHIDAWLDALHNSLPVRLRRAGPIALLHRL